MKTGLLVRLLVATVVVALCSVLGTYYLSQTTTARFNISVSDHNLVVDDGIYEKLLAWAGTHDSWNSVGPLVSELAEQSGRRVALITPGGEVIVDSIPGAAIPDRIGVPIDPLEVASRANDRSTTVDPGVIGAFRLTSAEQARLADHAVAIAHCAGNSDATSVVFWPTGRPIVNLDTVPANCHPEELATPLESEQRALDDLADLVNRCLAEDDLPPVSRIEFDSRSTTTAFILIGSTGRAGDECLQRARAEQSIGLVAPPAYVIVTDLRGDQRGIFDLSPGSIARISLVAGGILLLVFITVAFIGAPLLRSVYELDRAARRLAAGDRRARVRVRGSGELAALGRSFNTMSEELDRNDQQRRQLFSDIAHELRTPLTSIRGLIEAAQDGVVPVDRELGRVLHDETLQLQHVIADLQNLALADAGELRLVIQALDFSRLLSSIVTAHEPQAREHDVTLASAIEPGLEVRGDSARIRQAIDNLIINAISHTPGGEVTVTARRARDIIEVAVRDTGKGIAREDLDHIFDRFWRADHSRSRISGGSGLGLSIAREFIKAHNGTVNVQSELGEGTTFTVRLVAGESPSSDARS